MLSQAYYFHPKYGNMFQFENTNLKSQFHDSNQ